MLRNIEILRVDLNMNAKIWRISCVLVAMLFSSSGSSIAAQLTRSDILQDAKQVEKRLKKYHPNLLAHRTSKQLRSRWNTLKKDIPAYPNYLDAATFFQKMLAAVCDEHTKIELKNKLVLKALRNSGVFPKKLTVLGNKLYLDEIGFSSKSYEIVSINKKTSAEIIAFLRSISSEDGCQKSDLLFSSHISTPYFSAVLLTNFLGQVAEFNVKYKKANSDKIFSVNYQPVSMFNTRVWRPSTFPGRSGVLSRINIKLNDYALKALDRSASKMFIRSNPDKSIFYVRVKSFDTKESQIKLIDKSLRELVKAKPKHVIIDLTSNAGGNIKHSQHFLSYFLTSSSRYGTHWRAKNNRPISGADYTWHYEESRKFYTTGIKKFRFGKKRNGQFKGKLRARSFGNPSYKGKISVLVSPNTKSAATFVATTLKRKAGAKVVGYIGDASMRTTCAASPGTLQLKRSNVGVLIPLVCYDRSAKAATLGNVKNADVPVDLTTAQSRKSNINILKAAVESISKSNQSSVKQKSVAKKKQETVVKGRDKVQLNFAKFQKISVKLAKKRGTKTRGWLGVGLWRFRDLNLVFPEHKGKSAIIIMVVETGSPADKAGLQAGNVILTVDDQPAQTVSEVLSRISRHLAGDEITMSVARLRNTPREFIAAIKEKYASGKNAAEASYFLGMLNQFDDFDEGQTNEELGYHREGFIRMENNGALVLKWLNRSVGHKYLPAMISMAMMFDRRRGEWHRPKFSALYAIHALKLSGVELLKRIMKPQGLTFGMNTRIEIQRGVSNLGIYDGPIDGIWRDDFVAAIQRLHKNNTVQLPQLSGNEILKLGKYPLLSWWR